MHDQYEVIADEYDMSFKLMPVRTHIEAPSVLQQVGPVDGLDVLDLACGTGYYARALQRAGAKRVVGVDVSAPMVDIAVQAERETKLGIDYHVGDAASLEQLGAFDLVLCVYLLHYAPSKEALEQMCAGIAANLLPGGKMVAFVMNPDVATEPGAYQAYGLSLRIPTPELDGGPVHFSLQAPGFTSPELTAYRHSRPTYEHALESAGFEDVAWHRPDVSSAGVQEHGADLWADYLARPHCVLLTARKRPQAS